MNEIKNIENLLKEAKENKWPYPKTFEALRDFGVKDYEVHIEDGYDSTYSGTFGTWKEGAPKGYIPTAVAENASQEKFIYAIKKHQRGETNFVELLAEIALAGISYYKVDIAARTVSYFDKASNIIHQEVVPIWNK